MVLKVLSPGFAPCSIPQTGTPFVRPVFCSHHDALGSSASSSSTATTTSGRGGSSRAWGPQQPLALRPMLGALPRHGASRASLLLPYACGSSALPLRPLGSRQPACPLGSRPGTVRSPLCDRPGRGHRAEHAGLPLAPTSVGPSAAANPNTSDGGNPLDSSAAPAPQQPLEAQEAVAGNGHPAAASTAPTADAALSAAQPLTAAAADQTAVAVAASSGAGPPGSAPSPPDAEPTPVPDLPPATRVDGLPETQKYVLADEWGYSQIGADLPDGVPPTTFGSMFPERFYNFDDRRAALALALPAVVMAAGYGWLWYMHSICPAWQTLLCGALIGTAYTGLFKVAHECARFAFLPQNRDLQDLLGAALMLPSLYPFPSWRLGYFHHLLHANMLDSDTFAWQPVTKADVAAIMLEDGSVDPVVLAAVQAAVGEAAARAAEAASSEGTGSATAEGAQGTGTGGAEAEAGGGGGSAAGAGSAGSAAAEAGLRWSWRLALLRLVMATPLKFFGSIGHWLRSFNGLDLQRFHPATYPAILWGWGLPIMFAGLAIPAMIVAGGLSGFLACYALPWLVFHFWLSTLSLLQHTAPHIPFRAEGEGYDAGRATICGTVTVRLPRPLELLLNDANYQLPQMVAPGLQCYHAREAYDYMRERLLPYLTEASLSLKLLTNHVTKWQVYDEDQETYRPLDEVEEELRHAVAVMTERALLEAVAKEEEEEEEGQEGGSGASAGGAGPQGGQGAGPGLAVA